MKAVAAEAAALSVPGVSKSEGGHASWSSSDWRLVTSHGFDGRYRGTAFSLGVGVIAEKDGAMERGGESRTTRHLADLPDAESIGLEGGRRAVARTGPRKIGSTTAPVIFENRVAASLIGPLLGAIAGILLSDYYLLRRTELRQDDLYRRALERYDELTAILDAAQVEDVQVTVQGAPRDTAREVLSAAGL